MGLLSRIQVVRRANLTSLCAEMKQAEVSRQTGINPSHLYQMSKGKGKHYRPVSDETARLIETRCRLAQGWLDVDRQGITTAPPPTVVVTPPHWPFPFTAQEWADVPIEAKRIVIDAAESAVRISKQSASRGRRQAKSKS